ncbi:aminotransferase class V-fold PLP-dependent enzyme [Acanthopleuribacter pedis]|uniref:Aminotransferase class V-fold PLP-dependent enzyme n=1 Tax=Acanthopleuribacter pedis TaxID=442870 RepID=A0A8J7U4E1_9BACT|nr:aminotransferase class V-fold PLP-dependent enzyme [Acanthopleuribacter pedis]MBO1320552.1 aminotransferase class V-fold PLP-dependent enzyme [Acanthopleuribacter pedis]
MAMPTPAHDCNRAFFNLPDTVTYLNCAYMSPMCQPVLAAGQEALLQETRPWTVMPDDFFRDSDHARSLFARLLGAQTQDIALIPSVSFGIAQAARVLAPRAGSSIVTLAEQFPSNIYPWQAVAKQRDCQMVQVNRPSDGDWTPAILDALHDGVSVAALPNCHWTDGSLIKLEQVADTCRRHGIALVLDVTQSLGAMPFDLARVRPAFLVAAGYKWLLGPYHTAFLYADPAYQQGEPLDPNWITRKDSENFADLVNYRDELAAGAVRYDGGQRSKFVLNPMSIAALTLLLDWGVSQIAARLRTYNRAFVQQAAELGFETLPESLSAPHIIGLRHRDGISDALVGAFKEAGISVSVRGSAIRVSPHLYNDEQDRARFVEVCAQHLG